MCFRASPFCGRCLYEHGIGVKENSETVIMYYKDVSSEKAKRTLIRCEKKLKVKKKINTQNFLFKYQYILGKRPVFDRSEMRIILDD